MKQRHTSGCSGLPKSASRRARRPVRRVPAHRLRGRFRTTVLRQRAQSQLKRFRQGSALAVAITGLLLLTWGNPQDAQSQAVLDTNAFPVTNAVPATQADDEIVAADPVPDPTTSLAQATNTIRSLVLGLYGVLPKLAIVLVLLGFAALAAKFTRQILIRALSRWERAQAIAALARIGIYVAAIAVSLSVLAGDIRALIGSIGLVGLALSWALQTPIESFTGWLLNSFRGYYRVGDRIEVGEVFGDVYRIDILTTTVWEAGGPGKSVAGAQSTGAMITFPNWEVLRSNLVNYSREFPFVWDEVTVGVANESDLRYAMDVFEATARRIVGPLMAEPAAQYRNLLDRAKLAFEVEEEPRVFLAPADAWTNCTVRYLVPARSRRRWSTTLLLVLSEEVARSEHRGKIIPAYPRTEVRLRENWAGQ